SAARPYGDRRALDAHRAPPVRNPDLDAKTWVSIPAVDPSRGCASRTRSLLDNRQDVRTTHPRRNEDAATPARPASQLIQTTRSTVTRPSLKIPPRFQEGKDLRE